MLNMNQGKKMLVIVTFFKTGLKIHYNEREKENLYDQRLSHFKFEHTKYDGKVMSK